MRSTRLALLLLVGLLPAAITCSDSTGPQVPVALNLVSGSGQTGVVGQGLPSPLVVKVVDAAGAGVPGVSVAWSVTSGGGSLSAAITTTDAVGAATVTWTLGPASGANAVSASVAGVPTIAAVMFSATAMLGQATKVAFTVQPSAVVAGVAMSPAVKVTVQEALGNTVTTSTSNITLSITGGTGSSGALLGGTVTQAAVAGVATFANLTLDRAGSGYSFTASATGLTSAVSAVFTVTPAAATTPWKQVVWSSSGDLVTSNFDGTSYSTLVNLSESVSTPKFSPDRTKLAYIREATPNMRIEVWNGTTTLSAEAPGFTYDYTWHSDGHRIFYTRNEGDGQIWVIDFAAATPTASLFYDPPVYRTFGIAVSPDGSKMVLVQDPSNSTPGNYLSSYSFAQGVETTIYPANGRADFIASYSPVQDEIVWYQLNASNKAEIWRINGDGTNPVNLSATTATVDRLYPRFSPDGTQVFYVEGGVLYVIARSGGAATQVRALSAGVRFDVSANY